MLNHCLDIPILMNNLNLSVQKTINSSFSPEKIELIRQLNIDYGKNYWRTINIDRNYQNLLSKGRSFRDKYMFREIVSQKNADSIIELQNSICSDILNNFNDRIINPHNKQELFINQNCSPTFEVIPYVFYKKYLYLESHRSKINLLKAELENYC
jgi:hypothetical protein